MLITLNQNYRDAAYPNLIMVLTISTQRTVNFAKNLVMSGITLDQSTISKYLYDKNRVINLVWS